jgi:AP endonuclease-2
MLEEGYAILPDFSSYFSFSRKRTGYSGVATFCKKGFRPIAAEEGLGGTLPSAKGQDCIGGLQDLNLEFSSDELKSLDAEGRCVITRHRTNVLYTFYKI